MRTIARVRAFVALVATFSAILVPLMGSPSSAEEATEQARTRLLGDGWNQPGQVRLKWVTNTTWIASFGPHVVLFDSTATNYTWAEDGKNAKTTATSLDEIVAAKPEYIFQNHVHLDQMKNASDIAARSGAKLVGSMQHCEFAKRNAMTKKLKAENIHCDIVRDSHGKPFFGFDSFFYYGDSPSPLGATPFGEMGHPDEMTRDLDVTVVNIKHSAPRPWPDDLNPCTECYQPVELAKPMVDYVAGGPSPDSVWRNVTDESDEGTNLLYVVKYGDFTLVDHGSTSSLNKLEPGQADLLTGLTKVGEMNVDVELGGIAETQNIAQGMVDSRRYTEIIRPKLFFPEHHGMWGLPFATAEARHFYQPYMTEMAKMDAKIRPDICFIVEANRFTAWSFKASEWTGTSKGTVTPMGGPNCYTGP